MISAHQIRRSPIKTKLFFIIGIPITITLAVSLIMKGIIDSIYTNFIIYNPTTWSVAPPELADSWIPIGNTIVFILCFIPTFVLLWSTKVEDAL